jgi:hypothetical protein
MVRFLSALLLLPVAASAEEEEDIEEIVVWGDLFARWNDTRWMVTTELALPYAFDFLKDENLGFPSREFQLRTVIRCNKQWRLGRHRYEVDCSIEDFGMQAAIDHERIKASDIESATAVLAEIDAKLTGAALQLQVADDGRVTNLALVGVPTSNRRQSDMQETLRQVLSRLVVGFNLKLQQYNQLSEGKWQEYNSTIMTLPMPSGIGGAPGSSLLVHYLNKYKGHVLVQSIGKGVVQIPMPSGSTLTFETDLIGVSLFDDDEGFMTERVWALDGTPSASNIFDQGHYFHAGKIWMLGTEDKPDCGPTRIVNGRRFRTAELPPWEPIER